MIERHYPIPQPSHSRPHILSDAVLYALGSQKLQCDLKAKLHAA